MQPTTPLDLKLQRFHNSPTYTSCNGFAFAALTANSSVVTWGEAVRRGDSTAVHALLEDRVIKLLGSRFAFAALRDDGGVVWGHSAVVQDHNDLQVFGLSTLVATDAAFAGVKVFKATVSALSSAQTGGVLSSAMTNVDQLVVSAGAFAALKVNGSVAAWGNRYYGGVIPVLLSVVQIAATRDSFAARLSSGRVLAWGSVLGGGDVSAVTIQLSNGVLHDTASVSVFAALKNDSSLVTWDHGPSGGDASSVASQLTANVSFVANTF